MQVFVYGTLVRPKRAGAVLGTDYAVVGGATLEGLERVEGTYPTLVPGGNVTGRLLEVDEAGIERLDEYEGVDRGLYVRASAPRTDGAGRVWFYVGEPERLGITGASWPGEGPFEARVCAYCSRTSPMVRPHE